MRINSKIYKAPDYKDYLHSIINRYEKITGEKTFNNLTPNLNTNGRIIFNFIDVAKQKGQHDNV